MRVEWQSFLAKSRTTKSKIDIFPSRTLDCRPNNSSKVGKASPFGLRRCVCPHRCTLVSFGPLCRAPGASGASAGHVGGSGSRRREGATEPYLRGRNAAPLCGPQRPRTAPHRSTAGRQAVLSSLLILRNAHIAYWRGWLLSQRRLPPGNGAACRLYSRTARRAQGNISPLFAVTHSNA